MENNNDRRNVTVYSKDSLLYERARARTIVLRTAADYLEFNELLKRELNTYSERRTSDISEIIQLVNNVLTLISEDASLEYVNYSDDKMTIVDYSFDLEKSEINLALINDSEICKKTIAFGKCSGTYICTDKIKNSNLLSITVPYLNIPRYTINIIY